MTEIGRSGASAPSGATRRKRASRSRKDASPPPVTPPIAMPEVPSDPWDAFAWFMARCAGGFGGELMAGGKTETQARNTIIGCFLQMAAGEACRVARREGREPDPEKWRKATAKAFKAAARYTSAQGIEARQGGDASCGSVVDESPVGEADAPKGDEG